MSAKKDYSDVNGIRMYYEIHGEGKPLVLIHGGGSTIDTSFGRIIPELSKKRQVIGVEMQAHGRTSDRDSPLTFEQDADDVATLMKNLGIGKADILGFSNGGQTLFEIVFRHPQIVNKIILASTFFNREAVMQEFWNGFENITFDSLPALLQKGFLDVNNSKEGLLNMFNRDVQRMRVFKGWSREKIETINVPALILNGNHDVGSPEHAVEMFRAIRGSTLAIFPGGHGDYLGEITTCPQGKMPVSNAIKIIEEFLDS